MPTCRETFISPRNGEGRARGWGPCDEGTPAACSGLHLCHRGIIPLIGFTFSTAFATWAGLGLHTCLLPMTVPGSPADPGTQHVLKEQLWKGGSIAPPMGVGVQVQCGLVARHAAAALWAFSVSLVTMETLMDLDSWEPKSALQRLETGFNHNSLSFILLCDKSPWSLPPAGFTTQV